jgi:hypothetical protein
MKIRIVIVSLVTAICMVGCSKENVSKDRVSEENVSKESVSTGKAKGLVPTTAAEIATSPEFKLEGTTKSGIKCYVREISPEVARSIPKDSPDRPFLGGDVMAGEQPYLLAFAYNGKVFALTTEDTSLTPGQALEMSAWTMKIAVSEDKKRPRTPR